MGDNIHTAIRPFRRYAGFVTHRSQKVRYKVGEGVTLQLLRQGFNDEIPRILFDLRHHI